MAHDLRFWRFVCHELLIFIRRFEEVWHTISNLGDLCAKNFSFSFGGLRRCGTRFRIWAICVPKISHFFLLKFPEAEPAWHTKPEKTDLCAKVDRD